MHIEFYGATSGVTGSCHILRANGQLVLLDCGLIQGRREIEAKNREPFPFDPGEISAVVLSHGHIDHSGRIPLLVKQGYRGPVYAQNATCDLCGIRLPDAGHLQEEDARFANKRGFSKHRPALPLYTEERTTKRPTAAQILRLYSLTTRHVLTQQGRTVQIFEPEFTPLQTQVLRLLGIPPPTLRESN